MNEVLNKEETEFYKLPGKLGEAIGKFERGYLIGVMAPWKRGKTWWLVEMAVWGVLQELKTVFVSLEMSDDKVAERLYKRLTAFGNYKGDYVFPVFDCKKNQAGSCLRKERMNKITLLNPDGTKPKFDPKMKYKPCTYCREKGLPDYEPETWFTVYKKEKLAYNNVYKSLKALKQQLGDKLRIISYPAFTANIENVRADLDNLEYTEGFIPDVIVIDYADILAPEDKRIVGRDQIDLTWKAHKSLAASRHCIVFTASQTNRKSAERLDTGTGRSGAKKMVWSFDVAEDYRKLAHVDIMIILSQTPKEKQMGVVRVSYVNRYGEFDETHPVKVLQNFAAGQVILDSE